jgi:primosomal protein N' (replication factor Y)
VTSAAPFPTEAPDYCDVSLPVPIDTAFTYRLPETLRRRVRPGCRVLVPFGARKLTGVVLATHSRPPAGPTKDALRLLDEEPALDESLLHLGQWISNYYCAPLGETLRAMTPLASDIRRGRVYSLTPSGRDAARQLHLTGADEEDPAAAILRMLDGRALSASYLAQKVPRAAAVLRSLEKKGFVEAEEVAAERDPLRAAAARLRVEFIMRASEKIPKPERELLAYLELHPGQHNVAVLEDTLPKASTAARALARRQLARLALEPVSSIAAPPRAPHTLNPHQQAAFDAIRTGLAARQFQAFLLEGVTGSGKT